MKQPEPIRGNEPGTWAEDTITRRLPATARRIPAENSFAPEIEARLAQLAAEIPAAPLRFVHEPDAPDAAGWAAATRPYLGQNWLDVPWFFVETYFYRRVLEAIGYFDGHRVDPFAYQKQQGLTTTVPAIATLARQLDDWMAALPAADALARLIAVDLWGNRADLSLWPADEIRHGNADLETAGAYLLADDTAVVVTHLLQARGGRVDFLLDNAGFELVGDLALADFLLTAGLVDRVKLHAKLHPTFVSDATAVDIHHTAAFLAGSADPAVGACGLRLQDHLDRGRLAVTDHPFWVSPHAFWDLPHDLRTDLARSRLIVSKGDANYRRLLGDRHWPFTTPFTAIVASRPAPLLALRTLKAELAAGLTPLQIERLHATDPDWMVNGRYGVIQFAG